MSPASFGVRQPVPANLLMMALLLAGLYAATTLRKQFFPEVEPEQAVIRLEYPGATPGELESDLAVKIEDAIADLDEVDELVTNLSEGGGSVVVRFREGEDADAAVEALERRLGRLRDLPDEAEDPTVELLEPRLPVIMVAVYGEVDERAMKSAIRGVQDDLRSMPGMGQVVVGGVRRDEVSVEVNQEALLAQGVPLTAVAAAVGDALREVPGGPVRNRFGDATVRVMGAEPTAEAVRAVTLRNRDGAVLRVEDLAEVRAGFVDDAVQNRFNGVPSADLTVFKTGDQDIVEIAERVRAYVRARRGEPLGLGWWGRWTQPHVLEAYRLGLATTRPLPAGAQIATLTDLARFVEGRLDLLLRNAGYGAALVFATLLVFLNPRVAFWVGVGLVTALAGTLVLMWALDVTLNLLTMFGLIVVLGLLVDDAIVVAENIQSRHERGETAVQAAVRGAGQVQWPVVATVLTSIVAFLPLRFLGGNIGDLLGALPVVVACALAMSLLECLVILPSHMAHSLDGAGGRRRPGTGAPTRGWVRFAATRDRLLYQRVVPKYRRALGWCLRRRYLTVTATVAALGISLGLVAGGRTAFVFLPNEDAEQFVIELEMPIGTPVLETAAAFRQIESAVRALPEFRSVAGTVGQTSNIETAQATPYTPHVAQLFVELLPLEQRERSSVTIIAELRRALEGRLGGAERVAYEPLGGGPGGPDLTVRVTGADAARVAAGVDAVRNRLQGFAGVVDLADTDDRGLVEQRVRVRTEDAAALGISPAEVARQVRGFLFGLEAYTFAGDREDVDVRVRAERGFRSDLGAVERAWLVTPDGRAVPLREVADLEPAVGYASIRRVDRERAVDVTAYTSPGFSPEAIAAELDLPSLRAAFPSLGFVFAGRQEEVAEAFASLPYGMTAAAVMIYIILAWLFGSYTQPLTVMAVIPFSLIGAVWGHYLLGYDLTFLSLIGLVALAGIVVNDSLILVRFYNERREAGAGLMTALLRAGPARFRAILLTTLTTVLGLTPLVLEQSFQARFLIPMAIAIAAGLLSATGLILLVLPCLILILEDLKALVGSGEAQRRT